MASADTAQPAGKPAQRLERDQPEDDQRSVREILEVLCDLVRKSIVQHQYKQCEGECQIVEPLEPCRPAPPRLRLVRRRLVDKPLGRHVKDQRQPRKAHGVRQPRALFPAAHGLARDAQLLRQPLLRPAPPGAEGYQLLRKRHTRHPFPMNISHESFRAYAKLVALWKSIVYNPA